MIQNTYYSQEVHGAYELFELGDFPLEEGGALSGAEVAYVTFGELNAARDNAILFPTWYLICMARKWQRGDVSRHTGGDLAAALARITAKTFVLAIDEDMLSPVRDCAAEQELIPGSELRVINSIAGHLALFGADPGFVEQVDRDLGELLAADV